VTTPVKATTNQTKVACRKQPYFSLNKDKRTRLIYLGQKRVDLARQYSRNYKRLLAIIEEMTILNMELLKRDADL